MASFSLVFDRPLSDCTVEKVRLRLGTRTRRHPMSKKKIKALEAEVERLTTVHTDLVAQHGALQSKHEALTTKLDRSKTNEQTQMEECSTLKKSLAQQENKFQDYQATMQQAQRKMQEELNEAKLSAQESAEAAESAAATATAAAAAAAAMAGSSDDEDDDERDAMGEAMMDAEAAREIASAETSVIKEQIDNLRTELKEETKKRNKAETKLKQLEDQQGLTSMSNQLKASEDAAHKCSSDLVLQGEKNLQLSDKYQKVKQKLETAEENVNTARRALIIEIAGEDAEFELYAHVSFTDLARLALQGKRNGVGSGGGTEDNGGETLTLTSTSSGQSLDAIRKAEKDIKALRTALRQCQSDLEVQRGHAAKGKAVESMLQQLKDKNMELANRVAREKDRYVHQKDEVRRRDDRLQALSDHIEKLMIHLKHEAAAKAKAVDQQKRGGREVRWFLWCGGVGLCWLPGTARYTFWSNNFFSFPPHTFFILFICRLIC